MRPLARKKKRKNLLAALLDGLLTVVDMLCEGVAEGALAALRLLGRLILLALRGMLAALGIVARVLLWPFVRLFRLAGGRRNTAARCLRLTGEEFEAYMARVLADNGFRRVTVTRASGDQGVDILAVRNGRTYAIQCKNYVGAVGNAAVQEAYAGAEYYGCDIAAVVCPGEFTRAARELAESVGVELWDGQRLSHMMRVSGRRPLHKRARRAA